MSKVEGKSSTESKRRRRRNRQRDSDGDRDVVLRALQQREAFAHGPVMKNGSQQVGKGGKNGANVQGGGGMKTMVVVCVGAFMMGVSVLVLMQHVLTLGRAGDGGATARGADTLPILSHPSATMRGDWSQRSGAASAMVEGRGTAGGISGRESDKGLGADKHKVDDKDGGAGGSARGGKQDGGKEEGREGMVREAAGDEATQGAGAATAATGHAARHERAATDKAEGRGGKNKGDEGREENGSADKKGGASGGVGKAEAHDGGGRQDDKEMSEDSRDSTESKDKGPSTAAAPRPATGASGGQGVRASGGQARSCTAAAPTANEDESKVGEITKAKSNANDRHVNGNGSSVNASGEVDKKATIRLRACTATPPSLLSLALSLILPRHCPRSVTAFPDHRVRVCVCACACVCVRVYVCGLGIEL
jgi:hypothetical protein